MKLFLVENYDGHYEPAFFVGIATSLEQAISKIAKMDYKKLEDPLKKLQGILITEVEADDFRNDKIMKFYNYLGEEVSYKA